MRSKEIDLAGWGLYPHGKCHAYRPESYGGLTTLTDHAIARGQGRSYGDAALNIAGTVVLTERLNRILSFDSNSGVVRAEAGVTIKELIDIFLPQGWFPAVTPGTKFVSLGGCIAADVHGKNHHHAGSFASHLESLQLITGGDSPTTCGPDNDAEIFWATLGGMGLTGHIGEASLRLRRVESGWISAQHHGASDLETVFKLMESSEQDDDYSVTWIDSLATGSKLGRGVYMRGHHALPSELPPKRAGRPFDTPRKGQRDIPLFAPGFALNQVSIKLFNRLYGRNLLRRSGYYLTDYDSFFYPLDAIGNWNRLYGRRGFLQYQCILPRDVAFDGMRKILEKIANSGLASFLAVLKRLGSEGNGLLSFPMPGYTLALDFPYRNDSLLRLLDELDEIVIANGGRVYLAKDARLKPDSLRQMYPRLEQWLAIKKRIDPNGSFTSSLGRRLELAS